MTAIYGQIQFKKTFTVNKRNASTDELNKLPKKEK